MDSYVEDGVSDTDDSEDEDYVPEGADQSSCESEPSDAEAEFERGKVKKSEKIDAKRKKKKSKPTSSKRLGGIKLEGEEYSEESESSESEESSNLSEDDEVEKEAEKEREARVEELWKSFKADAEAAVVKKPNAIKTSGEASCATKTGTNEASKSTDTPTQPVASTTKAVESTSTETANIVGASLPPHSLLCGSSRLLSTTASSLSGPTATKRPSNALETMLSMASGSKKSKLSTLEQSRQDWNKFTEHAGITDELRHHNKDGFLEKRDFLQRADLRQWEQERTLRMGKRR